MSYQRSIRNEKKEKTYLFSMNPYLARTKRFQVLINTCTTSSICHSISFLGGGADLSAKMRLLIRNFPIEDILNIISFLPREFY